MSFRARAQERATTLQEQEVHQYYQPWLASQGSRVNVAHNVDSIAAQDLQEGGYRARTSKDKALMAFAQLATLRLNVRRAMVSLIDSRHQYILTEATKSVSLVSDKRHETDDELWLGNAILNREDAVCHHTFMGQYTTTDSTGLPYEGRGLIVDDCRLDDRFKDRSYVQAEPGVRFYAGVPIVTRSGHAIGAYAVSDDKPRNGLTHDEFLFMQDLAVAVLEHLEWARDRVDRFKGERLVRGLANFIDVSSSTYVGSESRKVGRDGMEFSYEEESAMSASGSQESTKGERKTLAIHPKLTRPSETESDGDSTVASSPRVKSRVTREPSPTEPGDLSTILARAARVLRKSTLADGVVFLGQSNADNQGDGLSSVDEEHESNFDKNDPDFQGEQHALRCGILGSSLGSRSDQQSITTHPLTIHMLERYCKEYPEGKTLHFTNYGLGIDSGDESSNDSMPEPVTPGLSKEETSSRTRRSKRKQRSRVSHAEIIAKLPGVRTMIFLPIKDLTTNNSIAGAFIWTSTPDSLMNLDQDLSYLRAFGNSISSEIARADAAKLDRAKTTFIASLSHELRSPLHGILGSVEFLQDTASDSYQTGLITSIANCSRTLLDTLSNLLSYAKVTTMESATASADVELGSLVEEVVEAVCAGYTFKKMHAESLTSTGEPSLATSMYARARHTAARLHTCEIEEIQPVHGSKAPITVLLDIAPSLNWNVSTSPGALRRVIMNLVGNALKYTEKGFVAVSLRAEQRGDKIYAVFRVVDSGRGISEDFLRSNLFVPFKQEDTFASGTGLGLSIVKQLVESLGGTISVKSLLGKGTEVQVSLELDPAKEVGIDLPDDDLLDTAGQTKGLRLCVLDPNDEKQQPDRYGVARLDTMLGETCSTWFGMDVTTSDNMSHANTDMFLYTEPPSLEYLLEHHSGGKGEQVTPLIIVCMNTAEAVAISNHQIKELSKLGQIVEVIPQPCGPRKLGKVLQHCLQRRKDIRDNPNLQDPQSTGTSGEDATLGKDQRSVPQDSTPQIGPRHSPSPTLSAKSVEQRPPLPQHETFTVALSKAVAFPDGSDPKSTVVTPSALADEHKTLSEPGTPTTKPLHVLVVDDNSINVDLLVKFVNKFKLTYAAAYNGQEALDQYISAHKDGKRFDWVLMDISMPVMDGIEATRRIREYELERGLSRTHVVALTAFASTDTQQQATLSGVDLYLPKPVKFAQLKKLLLEDK